MAGRLTDLDPRIDLERGITVAGNVSVPGAVCDRISDRGQWCTGPRPKA